MIHSNLTAWCNSRYNWVVGTRSVHANTWLLKIMFEVKIKHLESIRMQ